MPTIFPPSEVQPAERNLLHVRGVIDPGAGITELVLEDGRVVRLATQTLLHDATDPGPRTGQPLTAGAPPIDSIVVPIVEERLHVEKRVVETGKVRLLRSTQEYDVTLDETLAVRSFDVERIVLNQPVETAPPVRHEGNSTIYPLVEEQLVLTRQLVLKEELRVTLRDTERHDTRSVTLRREIVELQREPLV